MAAIADRLERLLDRYFDEKSPEPVRADVERWLAAALELAAQCDGRRAAFDRIARTVGPEDLREWLEALPGHLQDHALADGLLRVADAYATILPAFAAEVRPRALMALGRTEDAIAAAEDGARAYPAHPHVLAAVGEVVASAGRNARAGELFEAALRAAAEDPGLVLDVLDRYLPWAETQGGFFRRFRLRRRREEAEDLLRAEDEAEEDGPGDEFEDEDGDEVDGDDDHPRPEPVTVAPVPGRNDPCPCGSGRKFKKCCGA
jgi:tetratricopeptide (TPR) repeat protein